MSQNRFYEVFEVFGRRETTDPVRHQFSLLAPNHEMAMIMAKENFFRREPLADIWVVRRSDIRMLTAEERKMLKRLDKPYRETKGYTGHAKRWRAFGGKEAEGVEQDGR